MIVTPKKYGNSLAIVIPKAICDLYDFTDSTKAVFEAKDGKLVITVLANKKK